MEAKPANELQLSFRSSAASSSCHVDLSGCTDSSIDAARNGCCHGSILEHFIAFADMIRVDELARDMSLGLIQHNVRWLLPGCVAFDFGSRF